jgi:hypothetical protein
MTSARFVNELHPNNIVIAEISTPFTLSQVSADDR